MATQSPPSNPADGTPPNPATRPLEAVVNEGNATVEPPKETSPPSVFVNSQPIREDQVQNAVNFLSHPRVRGSAVVDRRNFLERKGLTKEEIDEAFRRVPDPSPAVGALTSTSRDAQAMPSTNIQTQAPTKAMQPVTAAPSGVMSTMSRRFHWSHVVLAVGFLAISGAGTAIVFKNAIIPRLKSWIRRVVLDEEDDVGKKTVGKPSLAEEATAAAKAAAAAAADVARCSQEMLITQNEEKKCFAEFMSLLDVQLQEIKTMRSAITKLEGQSYNSGRNKVREEYLDGSVARSMQPVDVKSEFDMRSGDYVRTASPPASTEPQHPKSYMEIMAMVQRGERPPNVRDIDDRPPNPTQPISNPSLAPRAKPWESGQLDLNSSFVPEYQVTDEGSSSIAQDNGITYQYNNESSSTWWQQKNVRITEIENADGPKIEPGSNGISRPTQRRWVPPQAPPVSMPEAAVAIRQPKSLIPKDVNPRAENASQPVNELDELQRITRISESGGQLEMNGGSGSSEIQEEQVTEL